MAKAVKYWLVATILGLGLGGFNTTTEAACLPGDPYRVLVFTKTAGFRHNSIPTARTAIQQLGVENNFLVTTTENSANFTDANLAQFHAVIFLLTTGDVLNSTQQAAFERYIQRGGGYMGVHSATDTEYSWPWYEDLVGAYFHSHPSIQTATMHLEDNTHPSSTFLPTQWVRNDEWYNFRSNPRAQVHVLLSLDESTYSGGNMGDHPIAWYHEFDGGRSWYTAGGHTSASYSEPLFRAHLLGGIRYAAGRHAPAPPNALILYDGRDTSQWVDATGNAPVAWTSENGVLQVAQGSDDISTFQHFEDFQLHLEFRLPSSPPGTSENSLANSGIYLLDRYEVQIIESFNRPISGANESGAIWSIRDPSSNASFPSDTWEQFDITFRAPRWNGNTKIEDARVTVCWNGVTVQNNVSIPRPTSGSAPAEAPGPAPLRLQELIGEVELRNIWLVPLNTAPPPAPANLNANAGSSVITIEWDPNPGRTSYTVRRSLSDTGPFVTVATGLSAPAYLDWNITNGVTYHYRVSATTGGVTGPESSAQATAMGQPRVPITLIGAGEEWRYLDDGSNQGTQWKEPGFNDSSWRSGRAELGYGDGDEETEVRRDRGDGSRIITTYFRKQFVVTNAWALDDLVLRLLRDDGAVVYLNGTELFQENMNPGPITYTSTAKDPVGGNEESTFYPFNIPAELVVEGTNVLAVEIHQSSTTSSDISFDLQLAGLAYGIPELSIRRVGNLLLLSWPATPSGFFLEMAPRLGPGLPWASLAGFPAPETNNLKTVTMTHPFPSRYFRLTR